MATCEILLPDDAEKNSVLKFHMPLVTGYGYSCLAVNATYKRKECGAVYCHQ